MPGNLSSIALAEEEALAKADYIGFDFGIADFLTAFFTAWQAILAIRRFFSARPDGV